MLSNIYSKSTLQTSPHLRLVSNAVIFDRLLPIIQDAVDSNKPLDVHDLDMGLTMDFVSCYLFGLNNGTNYLQDHDFRKKWLHMYLCRKPFEFYHQETPRLQGWLSCVGLRVIPKYCDEANEVLDAWALDLCGKAANCLDSTDPAVEPIVYKQLKQSLDKQSLKETGSKQDPKQQQIDIACEMYDQLTAGFETSAVGLTYLFWELSKHPEWQEKLRKELMTLDPPIKFPKSADLPPAKSIDNLPVLEAIVTETLRLHAPIPGIQPRVTPSPSCSLAGYDNIPPNTRVNAQAYSLHRNPEVFPDPESWQPNRWLKEENSPAELEERRRWFWAFGSGGRMCVGSNLALQGMFHSTARSYSANRSRVQTRCRGSLFQLPHRHRQRRGYRRYRCIYRASHSRETNPAISRSLEISSVWIQDNDTTEFFSETLCRRYILYRCKFKFKLPIHNPLIK
jgi:unspecific monooxygenase